MSLINSKQSGFIKPLILTGIILTLAVFAFVIFLNPNKPQQISNIDTVAIEKESSVENDTNLYSIDLTSNTDQLTSIKSTFQLDTLDTYNVSVNEDVEYKFTVAKYKDESGNNKQAIVYLPSAIDDKGKTIAGSDKSSHFRYEKWLTATDAIKKYTPEQALFVSYWDNSQRIHLFTGRDTWLTRPDQNAYSTKAEQSMWKSVAGSFDTEGKLSKYSQFLLLDMDKAIIELQKELPENRDAYILVSNDDLAHVQDIAALTGQGLPLETKVFPANTGLHNSISKVKEWAKEGDGTGSYLVQPMSEKHTRVWRITDKAFENSLLVRLLPFTSSLDRPLIKTKLVFQSDWGAYLSIYKLIN